MKILTTLALLISASAALADTTITCGNGTHSIDMFSKNRLHSEYYQDEERLRGPYEFAVVGERIQSVNHPSYDNIQIGIPETAKEDGKRVVYEWGFSRRHELQLLIITHMGNTKDALGQDLDPVWKYNTYTYDNCTVKTQ